MPKKELANISDQYSENENLTSINVKRQIIDGRLSFQNQEDLLLYTDKLRELTETAESSSEIFGNFEEGYNSLRSLIVQQNIDFLNASGTGLKTGSSLENLDPAYPDFIIDDIRESVLNEYYEVGVGSAVYVYVGLGQLYQVDCPDDVIHLRQAPKGITVGEFIQYKTPSMTLLTENPSYGYFSKVSPPMPTNDCLDDESCLLGLDFLYHNEILIETDNCDPLFKQLNGRITEQACVGGQLDFPIGKGATYTIDWGDGSSDIVITQDDSTPQGAIANFSISHQYSNDNVSEIVIDIQWDDLNPPALWNLHEHEITFDLEFETVCTEGSFNKSKWIYDCANERAMKSEVWFISDNWLSNSKAGACTYGYKLKNGTSCSNPEWKSTYGAITVNVTADFLDGGCGLIITENDSGNCGWCKSKSKSMTCYINGSTRPKMHLSNSSVFSIHTFNDNGASLWKNLFLNPCP